MSLIYSLILIIFLILIISYFFNHDILFPANILSFSFLIFTIYASLLMRELNDFMLYKTFFILIVFIGLFALFSNTSYFISNKLYLVSNDNASEKKRISFINISSNKALLILIIQIIILIIVTVYLKKMLGSINSQTLAEFREATEYHDKNFNYSIPYWIQLLINFSKFTSFFSMFVLINNHFSNIKKYQNKIILIISSFIFIPLMVLSASRYGFIIFILYSLFLYVYFSEYLNRNIYRPLCYIFISIVFVSWIFKLMGQFIGRTENSIVMYIGGSIVSFNNFIRLYPYTPHQYNVLFGENTFNTFYEGLKKLHLIMQTPKTDVHQFNAVNYHAIGNVYTTLRPFYEDFGFTGIIMFAIILGIIFGILYCKIRSVKLSGMSILLLIYAMISGTLMLSPYAESIFGTFLSLGFVINVLMLLLLKKFYEI